MSEWLDGGRWRRLAVVVLAIVASIGMAIWGGFGRESILRVDANEYVAVAGLFVAALGVERLNELLVAPWVGRGDPTINRNILVGSFGLLFGVTISAALGLSGQSLFGDDAFEATSGFSRSVGIFIAGLAIAGGGKPLHDLISRLEKNVENAKTDMSSPSDPDQQEVAVGVGSRQHRIAVDVEDVTPGASIAEKTKQTKETVATLLPGWKISTDDDRPNVVTASTFVAAPPGSADHRRQLFSAAHRVQSQKQLLATPRLLPAGKDETTGAAGEPAERRWTLEALGLDARFYEEARGTGVTVAVLDTGVRNHPDGVDETRLDAEIDTLTEAKVVPESGGVAASVANWFFDGFDFDVMSSTSHGTSVASVIAAGGTPNREAALADDTLDPAGRRTAVEAWWNESPMIGVAPDARILPVKVMRGPVHIGDDDVALGVRAAAGLSPDDEKPASPADEPPPAARKPPADIISMSLGGFGFEGLDEAIDAAVNEGVIVVCAAGNNFNVVVEPAFYGNTVAVAGLTRAVETQADGQERVRYEPFEAGSSRGPEVDVTAPGHQVPRAHFKEVEGSEIAAVDPSTGTTYATAHVSGVAALWMASHGTSELRQHYRGDRLPRLFKYALRESVTEWDDDEPWLADNWGPGRVNVRKLLDFEVFDRHPDGTISGPRFPVGAPELDGVFPERQSPAQHDRIVGGIAAVLAGPGTEEVREPLIEQLGRIPALLVGEVGANSAGDGAFREKRKGDNPEDLPVPAGATQELSSVLSASSGAARRAAERQLATTELDENWGVGFSRQLRKALRGEAETVKGKRWIGVLALAVAIAIAVGAGLADRSFDDLELTAGFASLVGFLAIGVYAVAQGIERLLEFTVARVVYRGVPGREADRALIMLGAGVVVGVFAATLFDVGLISMIAVEKPVGAWDEGMDAMVTGLAVGGGAKPVHDLLTRIRLPLDK